MYIYDDHIIHWQMVFPSSTSANIKVYVYCEQECCTCMYAQICSPHMYVHSYMYSMSNYVHHMCIHEV